jgi:hypothetical protein
MGEPIAMISRIGAKIGKLMIIEQRNGKKELLGKKQVRTNGTHIAQYRDSYSNRHEEHAWRPALLVHYQDTPDHDK